MRMRVLLLAIFALVFAVMLIIDPVALVQLGYVCVAGGCGVSPVWLAVGAAVLAAGWAALALLRDRRSRRTAAAGKSNRPRRAVRPRRAATAAKPGRAVTRRPKRTR